MAFDVAKYRRYMMDDSSTNVLLGKEEFSDLLIEDGVEYILDDYNSSPPTSITIARDSAPISLLYPGVTMFLLDAAAQKYRRNRLPYNAGNVSVDDMNKEISYQQASAYYNDKYTKMKHKIKLQQNISGTWTII